MYGLQSVNEWTEVWGFWGYECRCMGMHGLDGLHIYVGVLGLSFGVGKVNEPINCWPTSSLWDGTITQLA